MEWFSPLEQVLQLFTLKIKSILLLCKIFYVNLNVLTVLCYRSVSQMKLQKYSSQLKQSQTMLRNI